MAAFNPTSAAAAYAEGMASGKAKAKYIAGVNGVTENPLAKAALQKDKAVNAYAEALNSGRWASSLNAFGFEQWKALTAGQGANNLQAGAKKGQAKYTRALTRMAPLYQQSREALASMPNTNIDEAMARVRKNAEIMQSAKTMAGY